MVRRPGRGPQTKPLAAFSGLAQGSSTGETRSVTTGARNPSVPVKGLTPQGRIRTALYRIRTGYGVPKYELVEVEQLGHLVLEGP